MIDRNETVVNTYRYSPFGESIYKDETVFNPYQFTGRRYDEESGQYYYRARIYSAEQARFMSQDPAKEGANLYAYVGNNPTNRRDPSGLFPPPDDIIDGGGGGGGTGYDMSECPLDWSMTDFADCVDSYMDNYYSANEATSCCIDVCYETGWCNNANRNSFDWAGFYNCMGWSETASVAFCAASLIAVAGTILLTGLTGGAAIGLAVASVIGAATTCAAAAYMVNQCL